MKQHNLSIVAFTGLRIALGTAFLSAVAGRLGIWGKYGGNWAGFVKYTGEVNWYLPSAIMPAVAIAATVFETAFGFALVAGWQVRRTAAGAAGLLTLFALAMFSADPKSPFDYSVFTAAFGALTLAAHSKESEMRN